MRYLFIVNPKSDRGNYLEIVKEIKSYMREKCINYSFI